MKIRLALAVNSSLMFDQNYFADAEQFLTYEWNNQEFNVLESFPNPLKLLPNHTSVAERYHLLIRFLHEQNISILVANRFSENLKSINDSFVPVLVNSSSPEDLFPVLQKRMRWIEEEWLENAGHYKLFNLQRGALKTAVSNNC